VVFIRHHTAAEEVDEEDFFHSRETGGTVVSSALELMRRSSRALCQRAVEHLRAQASDGDNWDDDSELCRDWIEQHILPVVQYYAYVEISDGEPQNLWDEYEKLARAHPPLRMQRIRTPADIYPVFRELFRKRLP
jgi:uncharacterized sporulation protein YeaH/YhbH (DUF444 family)